MDKMLVALFDGITIFAIAVISRDASGKVTVKQPADRPWYPPGKRWWRDLMTTQWRRL
jgi:hypothetical protein